MDNVDIKTIARISIRPIRSFVRESESMQKMESYPIACRHHVTETECVLYFPHGVLSVKRLPLEDSLLQYQQFVTTSW